MEKLSSIKDLNKSISTVNAAETHVLITPHCTALIANILGTKQTSWKGRA
jgi:aromatic ring-opening dioxygenase LigB subunit